MNAFDAFKSTNRCVASHYEEHLKSFTRNSVFLAVSTRITCLHIKNERTTHYLSIEQVLTY